MRRDTEVVDRLLLFAPRAVNLVERKPDNLYDLQHDPWNESDSDSYRLRCIAVTVSRRPLFVYLC